MNGKQPVEKVIPSEEVADLHISWTHAHVAAAATYPRPCHPTALGHLFSCQVHQQGAQAEAASHSTEECKQDFPPNTYRVSAPLWQGHAILLNLTQQKCHTKPRTAQP